ncbi:MAG TPA: glutaminyl-peptide cyclotransferase, partial [Terracidiphilus sp.]
MSLHHTLHAWRRCCTVLLVLRLCCACVPLAWAADTYKIIHTYPHDPRAYTQGLLYQDGHLYESTGLNGRSSLRMVDLETGRVLQSVPVPSQ